jgi:hypothetical protein
VSAPIQLTSQIPRFTTLTFKRGELAPSQRIVIIGCEWAEKCIAKSDGVDFEL